MKLVVAVVRPEKLPDVLEALFRADVRGLTLHRVEGHGGETERVETYRGTTVKMELSEKVRLEIGVSDHFVEPTVRAILTAARTGDGRRRQDLRPARREGLPDPHRRRGPGRGHARRVLTARSYSLPATTWPWLSSATSATPPITLPTIAGARNPPAICPSGASPAHTRAKASTEPAME